MRLVERYLAKVGGRAKVAATVSAEDNQPPSSMPTEQEELFN